MDKLHVVSFQVVWIDVPFEIINPTSRFINFDNLHVVSKLLDKSLLPKKGLVVNMTSVATAA